MLIRFPVLKLISSFPNSVSYRELQLTLYKKDKAKDSSVCINIGGGEYGHRIIISIVDYVLVVETISYVYLFHPGSLH